MTTGVIQYPHYQTLALYKLRTPTFYYLPKIHKNKNPPPGRPIVSGPNGPTYGLNLLVDHFLTDLEDRIPYLLKDTTTFLNYIDTHPPTQEDTILVTMDVSSLYTNIPHQEGIDLVVQFYREHQPNILDTFQTLTQNPKKPSVYPPDCQLLQEMLSHILRYNTFEFNNEFYVQKQGTAMGAPFAVKFANIVMHMLLLFSIHSLFPITAKSYSSYFSKTTLFFQKIIFLLNNSLFVTNTLLAFTQTSSYNKIILS